MTSPTATKAIRGSIVALVTPFAKGKVDEAALKDLVEWHIAEGTHGIVPVGTTGESPTLSHDEHERVIEIVVRTVAGRIPVIAGAGSNNTTEAVRFMQFAHQVGADAALVVTPYYNKPTQEGIVAHYTALHEAAELPIILYNIPGRSVIDILPETMGKLARLPRIIGVKDATGNIGRVTQQRAICGKDFIQLSGNDDTALAFNAHGGVGCISVTANVAPRACAKFQEAMLRGDYAEALLWQDRLAPLHFDLFCESNPAPVKFALAKLGRIRDELRLPLLSASAGAQAKVLAAMKHAGLIN